MTAAGRLAGRCEHCRPAGIKAGQSAAPLSHLRRQLPLQGSHQTAGARKGSPARGAGCAARRRLRGAAPCGANIRPGRRAGVQRRCKSRRSSLCGCGGKVLPPAGIKVGQSAAPLSHLRRQLPLQGSHQTAGARKGSPARGAGCAARRRLRGAAPCGANIRPGHRAGAQRRSPGTWHFSQGRPQAGAGALSGQEKPSNIKGESVCPNCILSCPWPGGAAAFLKTALCSPSR